MFNCVSFICHFQKRNFIAFKAENRVDATVFGFTSSKSVNGDAGPTNAWYTLYLGEYTPQTRRHTRTASYAMRILMISAYRMKRYIKIRLAHFIWVQFSWVEFSVLSSPNWPMCGKNQMSIDFEILNAFTSMWWHCTSAQSRGVALNCPHMGPICFVCSFVHPYWWWWHTVTKRDRYENVIVLMVMWIVK